MTPFAYSVGHDRTDAHPSVHSAGTFDELQDAVLSARHDCPKAEAPYFSRAYRANGDERPQRGREFALPCAWVALDVDTLTPEAEPKLKTALAHWHCFWHSSMTATPENLKRRVVLECNRVVELAEHKHLVVAVESWLRERVGEGIEFDNAASSDLARLWYLPAEGAAAGAFVGEPIDVERALARHRDAEAEPERQERVDREDGGKLQRALAAIKAGAHLHDSLRDLAAIVVARGFGLDDACALVRVALETSGAPRDARFDERATDIPRLVRGALAKYAPAGAGEAPAAITVDLARLPAEWVETEQQPPPFTVAGLLPEAEAGSLVSPGGGSKSTLKLFESVHIILGRDLYGRPIHKPGAVLCVSKEDRAALIDYRLKKICQGLNLSDADMRRVHEHFLRLDLRGDQFMLQRIGTERIPFRSGDVGELLKTFAGEGIASAWFDTASRFATGEGNQESAVTLDACTVLADGWRATVEVLHHVSQGIARNGTVDMHASRGGTAFVDNGRFARQLVRHTGETFPGALAYQPPEGVDPQAETLIRMHVVKLTGARFDMHTPIWLERRHEWEFAYADGAAGGRQTREDRQAVARTEQAGADDAAILKFISEQLERQPPERMSQNALVDARGRIVRGISESRVREALGRLRLDGAIVEAPLPGKVTRGQRTFFAPAGWQEVL